ncbi:MAG: hypothetical protein FWF60_08650 [Oscillospiraceae bacterium]|nr:hypothetical protein [Oscillospiraceae bacterium]
MNHELIDRYIYAVTRRLPLKSRADVEQELASLISDMLEARCGAVSPSDKDVRVVLTELGHPSQLAAKYSGDEGRALIGGAYFLMYKFVLKLVLPIAAAGVALASVMGLVLNGGPEHTFSGIAMAIFGPIGGAFAGAIQAFAVITFLFAVLEWKKVKLADGDFLSALPPVPVKNERVKPWEPIAGMVLCVLMALVFLAFPQVMGGWLDGAGWIPALDVAVMRSLWLPIALWAALGIGKEVLRLAEGRYTRRLAIAASAANPVIAACAVIAFWSGRVMNPVFLEHMGEIFGEEKLFNTLFEKGHLFFLGVVFFALVLETVMLWVKARKYGNN